MTLGSPIISLRRCHLLGMASFEMGNGCTVSKLAGDEKTFFGGGGRVTNRKTPNINNYLKLYYHCFKNSMHII